MRKIFCLFLILSILTCTTTVFAEAASDNSRGVSDFTYLVIGLDDAGANTDVMILVRYLSEDNTVMLIQIPRDTYISTGTPQNKINQIYATERSKGASLREAMTSLLATVGTAFGVKIDGYIAYTTKAFVSFINGLSGIVVNMPFDLTLQDGERNLVLLKGENHLTGEEALSFVRYRKGYSMGDLGRIDAQKLLISSVVKSFKSSSNILKLIMLLFNNKNEFTTNIKTGDVVNIAMKNRGRLKKMCFEYLTLPGSSVQASSGLWYFSANKYATQTLYNEKKIRAEFDGSNLFCNYASDEFQNIYFSKKITPRIYNDESLKDMVLRQNSG